MIIPEFYQIRKDGIVLIKRIDAKINFNGIPLRDENGHLVPNGFKIRKVGTDELYDEAIDVETSLFVYEETQEPIERDFNDV